MKKIVYLAAVSAIAMTAAGALAQGRGPMAGRDAPRGGPDSRMSAEQGCPMGGGCGGCPMMQRRMQGMPDMQGPQGGGMRAEMMRRMAQQNRMRGGMMGPGQRPQVPQMDQPPRPPMPPAPGRMERPERPQRPERPPMPTPPQVDRPERPMAAAAAAAAAGQRPVVRLLAEVARNRDQIMKKYDRDGDGSLSERELAALKAAFERFVGAPVGEEAAKPEARPAPARRDEAPRPERTREPSARPETPDRRSR